MSALTEAANDELDAQLLAMTNIIDGLSLVISRQQAVMRQALEALEACCGWPKVIEALREVLGSEE